MKKILACKVLEKIPVVILDLDETLVHAEYSDHREFLGVSERPHIKILLDHLYALQGKKAIKLGVFTAGTRTHWNNCALNSSIVRELDLLANFVYTRKKCTSGDRRLGDTRSYKLLDTVRPTLTEELEIDPESPFLLIDDLTDNHIANNPESILINEWRPRHVDGDKFEAITAEVDQDQKEEVQQVTQLLIKRLDPTVQEHIQRYYPPSMTPAEVGFLKSSGSSYARIDLAKEALTQLEKRVHIFETAIQSRDLDAKSEFFTADHHTQYITAYSQYLNIWGNDAQQFNHCMNLFDRYIKALFIHIKATVSDPKKACQLIDQSIIHLAMAENTGTAYKVRLLEKVYDELSLMNKAYLKDRQEMIAMELLRLSSREEFLNLPDKKTLFDFINSCIKRVRSLFSKFPSAEIVPDLDIQSESVGSSTEQKKHEKMNTLTIRMLQAIAMAYRCKKTHFKTYPDREKEFSVSPFEFSEFKNKFDSARKAKYYVNWRSRKAIASVTPGYNELEDLLITMQKTRSDQPDRRSTQALLPQR